MWELGFRAEDTSSRLWSVTERRPTQGGDLTSQNVFINKFQKVNYPTKSSTYYLLLLTEISGRRLCGGVDFSKLFHKCIYEILGRLELFRL